jgi:two-component system, chemotaxis family, response regulator Rcp1
VKNLNLHTACDGVQALEFLNNKNNPKPDLILLDLNMPRKDGHETLAEIKLNPDLKSIPVIILTTSEAEKDVLSAYDKNANSYIVKPVDFNQFLDVIHALEEFWFTVVKLPPKDLE